MTDSLDRLYQQVLSVKDADPTVSRTARLLRAGRGKMAKKMAEEAVEVVIDAMNGDREALVVRHQGYRATYLAPYRPDYLMTNDYLGIDGWCYWFIYPNMLNRERVEHRKHEPIPS